jgi:hypothetical protein
MKIFRKHLFALLLGLTVAAGFSLTGPLSAIAATTPSLGAAASYGVLASTYTNTAVGTTINGDVGFTTGPGVEPAPIGGHTNYGSGSPYATAGANQASAASALAAQACTFSWNAAVNLFSDPDHGTPGVYTPGVYCSQGAMAVGGPITLSGAGTYIFRAVGALNTTAGAVVLLADGASACDVFWTPSDAATTGANTSFQGTVIVPTAAITAGANTTWTGRALAFDGTVTTGDSTTINVPTCAAAPSPSPSPPAASPTPTPPGVSPGPSATPSPGPGATPAASPDATTGSPLAQPTGGSTNPSGAVVPKLPNTGFGPRR